MGKQHTDAMGMYNRQPSLVTWGWMGAHQALL